jgi:hypothetical protein
VVAGQRPVDEDLPRRLLAQARQQLQQRGLAAAAAPDEQPQLVGAQREAGTLQQRVLRAGRVEPQATNDHLRARGRPRAARGRLLLLHRLLQLHRVRHEQPGQAALLLLLLLLVVAGPNAWRRLLHRWHDGRRRGPRGLRRLPRLPAAAVTAAGAGRPRRRCDAPPARRLCSAGRH